MPDNVQHIYGSIEAVRKGDKGDPGYTPVKGIDYFDGAPGADGADGAPGVGVPTGGTTGQVLAKASSTDYDTEWVNAGGGSTEIFWAVKDTTTSAEIEAAFQAGYLVCLSYNARTYTMVYRQNSTKHHFCNAYNNSIWLIVCDNDTWSSASSTSIPSAATSDPADLGTAAKGTSTLYARQDHVHNKPAYTKSDVGLGNVDNVQQYSATNPPPYPVTSVNGSTGAVTVSVPSAATSTPADLGTAAVGTSSKYAKEDHVHNKPTYTKSDVGLGNVDNVQQYSANNPPPYPVTSVNGSTGAVTVSVPSASSATPKALGTASAGSSSDFSRADHVHAKPSAADLGITIPSASSATPQALGTASAGSSADYSRADHVHAKPSASDVGAVAVAQGVGHAGEFCVVGSDGNITTMTLSTWQGGNY